MDFSKTNELIADITTLFYERKRLVNTSASTFEIDQKITVNVSTVNELINKHEAELSSLEEGGNSVDQLRELESELLTLSKQFDRIQVMVDSELGTSTARKPIKESFLAETQHENLDNHELLQLHERIINQQDAQLDSLAELLTRQKQIGEMISNELDVQVDLLDEVDERANATEQRMRNARNRLDGFMESSSESSRGKSIYSTNNTYSLTLEKNCQLNLKLGTQSVWSTDTKKDGNDMMLFKCMRSYLSMSLGGSLDLYAGNNILLWSVKKYCEGDYLVLQDNGLLVLTNGAGTYWNNVNGTLDVPCSPAPTPTKYIEPTPVVTSMPNCTSTSMAMMTMTMMSH
ncbi:hypothetical protein HK103_006501 [Boothiomyces macroporosus]|uniref:Uncharacterized protein n=1 Tax=Boothiomyces macroporosus TaxID=261099 RepID=A0AAD5UM44_9FUNG|nr:hypothetical protein HK103_006501 [Boothiomyces macroporosus]